MINTRFARTGLVLAGFVALAGCSSGANHPMMQSSSSSAPPAESSTAAAPAPMAAENPEVSPGMMRRVQTALRQQGLYKGHVDGVWGPLTQTAILDYQQAHGLNASGELNSSTLAALKIASASSGSGVPTANPTPPPPGTAVSGAKDPATGGTSN